MTRVRREVIMRYLRDLGESLNMVREVISHDLREILRNNLLRYSLRHAIIMIVEASTDPSIAILEKDFNETVKSYGEAFFKLAEHGVLRADIAEAMSRLVFLRNMIVHRYWGVDDARIYKEAGNISEFVEEFIREVLEYAGVRRDLGET